MNSRFFLFVLCMVVSLLQCHAGDVFTRGIFRYELITDTLLYESWTGQYKTQVYAYVSYNVESHFSENSGITDELIIPGEVKYKNRRYNVKISANGFRSLTFFSSVRMEEGVEAIGDSAFYGCSRLMSVNIPATVNKISASMVQYCKQLRTIMVDDGNERYDSREGCNAVVQKEGNRLIIGCNGTIIPKVRIIDRDAFKYCQELSVANIPEGVEQIMSRAFMGCYNLCQLSLPSSLKSIGDDAFKDCKRLSEVLIPANVVNIPYNPFTGCISLNHIEVSPQNSKYTSLDGANAIIETITSTVVSGCISTRIDTKIKVIGSYAFAGAVVSETINLPFTITKIADHAFESTVGLMELTIPSSVEYIGKYAFADCATLKRAKVYAQINELREGTFYECTRLQDISLPESLKIISSKSIAKCISLHQLDVPKSVKYIDNDAFESTPVLQLHTQTR